MVRKTSDGRSIWRHGWATSNRYRRCPRERPAAATISSPMFRLVRGWFSPRSLLLLIDTVASAVLRGLVRLPRHPFARKVTAGATGVFLLALAFSPHAGDAQEAMSPEAFALAATERTRLAYVLTGVDEIDVVSRMGLMGLSDAMRRRTAAELGPQCRWIPRVMSWPSFRCCIGRSTTVRRFSRRIR